MATLLWHSSPGFEMGPTAGSFGSCLASTVHAHAGRTGHDRAAFRPGTGG